MLALFLTACKQETSPIATAPPLTPPAAVSTPTEAGSAQTQAALSATKLPAQADAAPTPPASSLAAAPSPTVPAEVVARTSERVDELTARLLRPRRINVDVLWGGFVTSRAFGIGTDWVPDLDAPAKMLEMWHPGNACYAIVESEVDQLESDNRLRPVEFTLYFDYISAQLSPCLDEQLPQVDAEQFFSNSDADRADRVSTWFDSIWELSDSEALTSYDHCRDVFYAHLSTAKSATDALGLEPAWSTAMVEFSGCRRQAIRDDLPFLELRETQLLAFELNDRYPWSRCRPLRPGTWSPWR
jgi:hypothetical protein